MSKIETQPRISDEAHDLGYATQYTEKERRALNEDMTRALNDAGHRQPMSEIQKTEARRANETARKLRKAEQKRARRRGGLILSGAVLASAAVVGVANHFEGNADTNESTDQGTKIEVTDMSSPSTTIVTVNEHGQGIFSTVDSLVENGQIDPSNAAEYKQKALELHDNDANVQQNEGLHIPVDYMQPTEPAEK